MGFQQIRKAMSPAQLKEAYPLNHSLYQRKKERDQLLKNILAGQDDRFLVILGPCSADNPDAVSEYVSRLAHLQTRVLKRLFLLPRIYTNKPRSNGSGYKGIAHQPDLQKKPDIIKGLSSMRLLYQTVLKVSGLTFADELLNVDYYPYIDDLLSYAAIGARSVEDQQHRFVASGLSIPVGLKNPTSGNFCDLLDSCFAVQTPHLFFYQNFETQTTGNPYAHCILRGATDADGKMFSNYSLEDCYKLLDLYDTTSLKNPAVIIDLNHANSKKQYQKQPAIAKEILSYRRENPALSSLIKGVMLESYLLPGKQTEQQIYFGQSITDACLGWKETEQLILYLAESV